MTSVAELPDGRVVGLAYVRREVEDGAELEAGARPTVEPSPRISLSW